MASLSHRIHKLETTAERRRTPAVVEGEGLASLITARRDAGVPRLTGPGLASLLSPTTPPPQPSSRFPIHIWGMKPTVPMARSGPVSPVVCAEVTGGVRYAT
jgi:hypothetical protein